MPKSLTLPFIGTVFKRRREVMESNTSLPVCSTEPVETYLLGRPLVMPGSTPGWATQPWHYVFRDGDVAWALGGNRRWRLVTVMGDGFLEEIENRKQVAYHATWTSEGVTMRGAFAPGCGDIKPDTLVIRRLIFDEGEWRVERNDWQEVLDDNEFEDTKVEFMEGRSDDQV
ncbi:hypothetical protein B0F90DRAFT_1818467 [Multifurca ochricompacta]|uniref:Uncharacterized protein n=1 Tax=Multifurca ochricompacta TaxID=376703 RepID=A0AAD4M2F3_9AGAM|nr:hypothetical protein B0F90DRAFT_1818467 [Multifurca ochricompacta]